MKHQLVLLVLTAIGKYDVRAQIQYHENNTIMVPIWHLFKTTKEEWKHLQTKSTLKPLNWMEYHRHASIIDLFRNISKPTTTPQSTTLYPLYSFGTDRIFYNLSAEAIQLKKEEDYNYELDQNLSMTTEAEILDFGNQSSPRIYNVYKGVYLNDLSLEKVFWNKTYYEKFNRSINWSKKKAFWANTPTTPTTEWPYINITRIGDWQRVSFDINDLSYWDSDRRKEEYDHHYYIQEIERQNKTPTTEQKTPLIKLFANTRIASLWKLHSVLPYLNQRPSLKPPDTAEMRDLIYSEEFYVSPVLLMQHESLERNRTRSEYSYSDYGVEPNNYDYRDLMAPLGDRAKEMSATQLWDSRYYKQNFPKDMITRRLYFPTSPDAWEQWMAMDTWKRREYILRGWNTAKPDKDETRASPWVFTAHPSPTLFEYYDYQEYTPLVEYFQDKLTTKVSSREVSLIIWSEQQAIPTTPTTVSTTLVPGQLTKRLHKKRKVWTTARVRAGVKRRYNRTMSQQEIKRQMRDRYKKINEIKEQKAKDAKENEEIDKRFAVAGDDDPTGAPEVLETTPVAVEDFIFEKKLPPTKVPLKEYQCHICLKQLSSKGGYNRHINTHKRMGQWIDPF